MNVVQRILAVTAGVMASVVVVAPLALSSQDLVKWAASPTGLSLSGLWPYAVFVALDCAALLCITITVYSSLRAEPAGTAHILVWVFAGASAFANWRHSIGAVAKDASWFFPGMSIIGAVLLEVVVRKIRRQVRASYGNTESALPSFRVVRWAIAPGETFHAWKLAVLDGISNPYDAVKAVRGGEHLGPRSVSIEPSPELASMNKANAIRHAFKELGEVDALGAVDWLGVRGIEVSKTHAHNVARGEEKKLTKV